MILDKAIILKGVAGVAAVGGLATTGYIYKDKIGSSLKGSTKAEDNSPDNVPGSGVDDGQAARGGGDPQASVRSGEKGGGGQAGGASGDGAHLEGERTVQNVSTGQPRNGESGQGASITQPGTAATGGQPSTDLASNGLPGANRADNVVDTDRTNNDHSNQQVPLPPTDDESEHLGLPKGCKLEESSPKTCSITKEDLAKIDFSNKNGGELTVEGMNGESITLVITKMEGDETYTKGKKYIFKGFTDDIKIKIGDSQDNVITLEGGVDNDFKENSESKLEKVPRKVLDDETIKTLNQKLQNLGLPEGCDFNKEKEQNDQAAISCDIGSLENMNKIAFSDKTDNKKLKADEDEELENLKIKIKKLTGTEKTSYVSDLEEDLLFTFRDLDETLKWEGDPDVIFLPESSNTEFKLSGEKLSKLWTPKSLAQKVGLTCEDSNKECTIPATLSFKKDSKYFKNLSMSSASSGKFKFSEDEKNYNQGFKYTYEGDEITLGSGTETITLNKGNNSSFEIKYEKDNGWFLSHKS